IAESFRRFGVTDDTRDLLVLKITTTTTTAAGGGAEAARASIADHLATHVQGRALAPTDANLRETANLAKIKKAYKLGALRGGGDDEAAAKRLEMAILGAIALRGT
ncbi:hypothetical protein KEM52_004394, partial [Ascosphaera acerosa]